MQAWNLAHKPFEFHFLKKKQWLTSQNSNMATIFQDVKAVLFSYSLHYWYMQSIKQVRRNKIIEDCRVLFLHLPSTSKLINTEYDVANSQRQWNAQQHWPGKNGSALCLSLVFNRVSKAVLWQKMTHLDISSNVTFFTVVSQNLAEVKF